MKNRLLPITVSLVAILFSAGCAATPSNVTPDKTVQQGNVLPSYDAEPISPIEEQAPSFIPYEPETPLPTETVPESPPPTEEAPDKEITPPLQLKKQHLQKLLLLLWKSLQ